MKIKFFEHLRFLNIAEKAEFFKLILFSLIITILELVGISLIIPIVTILFNGNLENHFSPDLIQFIFLGFSSSEQIMYLTLFYFFLIILSKNFFVLYLTNRQLSFITSFQRNLSDLLFKKYIFSNFENLKNSNSSILISNITNETSEVANNYLMPIVLFCSEIILIFSIFTFLFFFDTQLTLIISSVMIFVILIYFKFLNKNLKVWGNDRQINQTKKIKYLQEGFNSIKETKLYQKENFFLNFFKKHNERYASVSKKFLFFSSVPKIIFEIVSISMFIIFIILTFSSTNSPEIIIQKMAVFAFVAFRILPSFNKITSSVQRIKFGMPAIDKVTEEINKNMSQSLIENNLETIEFKEKIKITNLSFTFKHNNKKIFDNFNFEINKGDSICLIGKSGSGKSTLLEIIMTLLEPSEGHMLVDGKNILNFKSSWMSKIGYVPQSVYFTDDSIKKNIAFGINEESIDEKRIYDSIEKAGLKEFVNNLKDNINYKVGEFGSKLSGGEKQRFGIARALYNNPEVLILDEPTSSLDEQNERLILNQIKTLKKHVTILIATHDEVVKNICDKKLRLNNQKIEEIFD